ncbi:MAG: pitrilysin family protein [Planctomycetota bacterium]
MSSFEFETVRDQGGVRVHCLPTSKFKALHLRFFFHSRLDATATELTLAQALAKRGCEGYPDLRSVTIRLEELYGSSISLNLAKSGERNLFVGRVVCAAEKYLPSDAAGLVAELLEFFDRLLTRPSGEGGQYRPELFEQERTNLRRQLEGLRDDKDAWAHDRFLKSMFSGEPYGLYEYGDLERLQAVTNRDVRARLEHLLEHAPVDIYVVGDIEPKAIADQLSALRCLRGAKDEEPGPPIVHRPGPETTIIEETEAEQARLLIGCPIDMTNLSDRELFALHFYNTLLGGGMFSKLFRSIREKASLAYSAHSSLDSLKGLLTISTGIDAASFEPALALIRQQLSDLAEGRIEEEEFRAAKETVVGRLASLPDSPGGWTHQHLELALAGRQMPLAELPALFRSLEPKDLVAVAPRVGLETIYLLRSPSQ